MRGKTGHLGHRACMHSRDLFPTYDGSVMAINRLANLQGAASSADDLAGIHRNMWDIPTIQVKLKCGENPPTCWGYPTR